MRDLPRVLPIVFLCATILAAGCVTPPPGKVIFRCPGGWFIPPAFHGNPYAPGGDGTHMHFIWEKLFMLVPATDEILPQLADSYHLSEDRQALEIKIKSGINWHDGQLFSSADVKTSFLVRYCLGWGQTLAGIETPDARTIRFHWRKPFSLLEQKEIFNEKIMAPHHHFAAIAAGVEEIIAQQIKIPLLPTDRNESEKLLQQALMMKKSDLMKRIYAYRPVEPVGTGPFKFSFVTASDLGLVHFKQHRDAARCSIDEIRLLKAASNDITWAYLIGGELDAGHPATSQDVTEQIMRLNPKVRLILPSDYGEFGFVLNGRRPPLSDPVFRKALARGIDRDMVRTISYYYAKTSDALHCGVLASLQNRWLDAEVRSSLTPYEYDPAAFHAQLQTAGYQRGPEGRYTLPDGTPIKLEIAVIAGSSDWILACESIANQLQTLGISAGIRAYEPSLYHQVVGNGDFDLAANFGTDYRAYAHPLPSFNRYFSPQGYLRIAAGLPSQFQGSEGGTVDVQLLLGDLSQAAEPLAIRKTVGTLARFANAQLPFLNMYEKKLMVFVVDGGRVSGWPDNDDPIWSASSGGLETVYSFLLATGRVKGVKRHE